MSSNSVNVWENSEGMNNDYYVSLARSGIALNVHLSYESS